MGTPKKTLLFNTITLILILTLLFPSTVMATTAEQVQPYASNYLTAYTTYICDAGNGEIQIWYEVLGKGIMDEIGTLSIMLYEVNSDGSLTWVKTFLHEDYNSMLETNDNYIYSHVSYQGSSSKTYKAYVCIWAGKNGSGDTRYMWATE